ncbi:MAG: helix-turn-helix domain-containing protein [Cyclobacteriaceae bacterium]|nr:helix-turn-helix domain-containing protein [Cyclobacteriaceae bacterium]
MKNFHQFILEKRVERDVTLREFCRATELDPSNWSKVERGIADPPKSKEVLKRIATALQFNGEETSTLMDLAMIESIPQDLRPTEDILEKLPIFFRTVRGEKPTEDELRKLIERLSNS